MNLIKRHKNLAIIGTLTLILLIIMFIIFARMIFSTGETEYGQRLKGLEKLDKSVTKEIINDIEEDVSVEEATIRAQGRIIYTTIIFKEGTKLDKAKEIASNTISKYDEEILEDYDLGFFLKENVLESEKEENDEETEDVSSEELGFVVAGTKHPDNEKISWTK